jgi:hypothetical protein
VEGVELQRSFQMLSAAFELAAAEQQRAEVVVRGGVLGIQGERPLVGCDRLLRVPEHPLDHAEVAVRVGGVRVQRQRRLEADHGRTGVATLRERVAEVAERSRAGADADRLPVLRDRRLELAGVLVGPAEVVVGIYYDPSLPANAPLGGGTYNFGTSGQLRPLPEPGALAGLAAGALIVAALPVPCRRRAERFGPCS